MQPVPVQRSRIRRGAEGRKWEDWRRREARCVVRVSVSGLRYKTSQFPGNTNGVETR